MKYADITGWGSYVPPLLMTNDDMSKIVDTSDEWIYSRSGIKQRHYTHVSTGKMAWLACERALAAAGVSAEEIDLIILFIMCKQLISCLDLSSLSQYSFHPCGVHCWVL